MMSRNTTKKTILSFWEEHPARENLSGMENRGRQALTCSTCASKTRRQINMPEIARRGLERVWRRDKNA